MTDYFAPMRRSASLQQVQEEDEADYLIRQTSTCPPHHSPDMFEDGHPIIHLDDNLDDLDRLTISESD